jgi:O-antigen ligase
MMVGAIALWVSWRLCRYMKPDLLMYGITAGTVALALATLAKAYQAGWFGSVTQEFQRRSATDLGWGTSNYIAALLTVMLPTAILLATSGANVAARVVGWVALPLTAMVVTIAASRGGSLLVLGVSLFAIFRAKIRPWIAFLAGAIGVALLLTGPGSKLLLERFTDVKDMASVVIRLWYWRVAMVRIEDHWPFGMGLGGGYGYLDRLYQEDPHNYWLVMASELGLPGLALWIAALVLLWNRIQKMARHPETQQAGRALQLTFWISQLNTMFEPTFQGLHYHFLWYWIMGTYLGYAERKGVFGDAEARSS